jgi:hypothetical protein
MEGVREHLEGGREEMEGEGGKEEGSPHKPSANLFSVPPLQAPPSRSPSHSSHVMTCTNQLVKEPFLILFIYFISFLDPPVGTFSHTYPRISAF